MSLLLLLCALFGPAPAQALKLSAVGMINSSQPVVSPATTDYESERALGLGALVELPLMPAIGIEAGFLRTGRKFEYEALGRKAETSYRMWEVPLLLRATLGGVLSIGAGGYYASYAGTPVVKDGNGNAFTHGGSDFGLATSLALYVPVAPLVSVLLDGRYNMGAKNNAGDSGDVKYRDSQLLVGLQLGM